jgi:hypothetical protein
LRPGGTLSACASGPGRDGELGHVELTALEIDIPSRNREEVRAVHDLLRKAHHNFRAAVAQHLHLLRLAEDGRLLLAEVQTVQRDGLVLEINERGQHRQRLPAIEIGVETEVFGFDALLLLIALTGFGARLRADAGAQDHHTYRKVAVHVLHDNSSPGVDMSNRQTSQLSLINR